MRKKPLSIGIAGAGLMGRWHAQAAIKAGGKIVAIVDTDEKQRKILGRKYPAAQTFSSVTEMLLQQTIDVLHVCIPTAAHYRLAETAIAAGINVLIEKPLASSTAQTSKLYELAKRTNVRLCPVHQFVFQRSVKKAKKMIARLGPIIHLEATICSAGGTAATFEKINQTAADILPHPLSLFQVFLPELLVAGNFRGWRPQKGELRVIGSAKSTSLAVFISLNARPTVNSFRIFAEKGTIHLDLFHDYAFVEAGKTSRFRKILRPFDLSIKNFSAAFFNLARRTALFEPAYPGLQKLVDCFYLSILEDKQLPISAAQAINIAQIRDSIITLSEHNSEVYSLQP